jgi:8-oxo-dGTP pyrophosphatase MutT (NUDIX family)
LTGSALVTTPSFDAVLLTLHGKLNKWLQLGGHADGDPDLSNVAAKEVGEESGLTTYDFLRYEGVFGEGTDGLPLPFDLDHHDIPARKSDPAHVHYDVRYVIVADPSAPLGISDESHDLKWLPLAEARRLTTERSMHRQFDKLEWLKKTMK